MNYVAWKFWLDVLVLVGVGGNVVYTWWTNRAKVNATRFRMLEEEVLKRATRVELDHAKSKLERRIEKNEIRLEEHEGWLNRLSTEVKHIPNRTEHAEISRRIEELHTDIHELAGSVQGLSRAVDLMNEYLINKGGN